MEHPIEQKAKLTAILDGIIKCNEDICISLAVNIKNVKDLIWYINTSTLENNVVDTVLADHMIQNNKCFDNFRDDYENKLKAIRLVNELFKEMKGLINV